MLRPKRRRLILSDYIQACLDEGTLLDEEGAHNLFTSTFACLLISDSIHALNSFLLVLKIRIWLDKVLLGSRFLGWVSSLGCILTIWFERRHSALGNNIFLIVLDNKIQEI